MPIRDYRNLGGWLLTFVIVSVCGTLLNIFSALGTLASGFVPALCLIVLIIALRISVLVCIFRRSELMRLLLIAEGCVMLVLNLYNCYMMQWDAFIVGQTFGAVLGYVLWITYLYKSERVRVYLHPDQYQPMMPMQYPVYQQPMQMPLQPMAAPMPQPAQCPSCGAACQTGAHFCGTCGQKL